MLRPLSIISILMWCLTVCAGTADAREADIKKEGEARWQKILTLKESALTNELAAEAGTQMEWFRQHEQWDKFYRAWQLKANALSALGKLQLSLQETQRMLNDAGKRDNKLGRAMAYKQIGVIYLNMKQTEPAIDALQHYAELMKDEKDDFSSLSNIYYRMAKAYDYDKAYHQELQVTNEWLKFLNETVGKQKTPEVRDCYNACYLARAASFIGLRKLEEAKGALDTASHHTHLINTAQSLHHFYKMKARYLLVKGDAAGALLYADSVRIITREKDDHIDEIRAQALITLGRGTEAARIYQQLYHEKDSVFGREARQHLDELNTLFQVDELKTEQRHTKLRYVMLAVFSIVLALVLLLLYGWRTAIKEKKANEQLRIANERATASSKMKTEFIRNISHEIRTPLNIVSGFTQILTTPDMNLPEEEKTDIRERMRENTDRITTLIDHMLELSDAYSESYIECNDVTSVQTLVKQAIEHSGIAQRTSPGNPSAAVAFDYADNGTGSINLRTNKIYAVRTLSQLLENAVKFTSKGSVRVRAEKNDNLVSIVVEDTGIGIPADQAENIFGEFVQLDDFADGTGIGLTIARSLALRMGGNLWLDTRYKQGARFVLELQRA